MNLQNLLWYREISYILTENLTEVLVPKHWTEISIKKKKFSGKRESHTIAGTRGLQFSVKEEGTYYEWRMTHKGRTYKIHIGSVHEVSLAAAKAQCEVFRKNIGKVCIRVIA